MNIKEKETEHIRISVYTRDPKEYEPTNDYDFLVSYYPNKDPDMLDPMNLNPKEVVYLLLGLKTNETFNDIQNKINKINKINTATKYDFVHKTMNIVQKSWIYDDDGYGVIDFFKKKGIPYIVLEKNEIIGLKLFKIDTLFADTDLISSLTKYRPPTYPECFQDLYKRKINLIKWKECSKITPPYFVKPHDNIKSFNATVVKTKWDLAYVKSNAHIEDLVYQVSQVNFLNEYRIFIGKNKVYGVVNSSVLNKSGLNKPDEPPKKFIDEILKKNIYDF